MTKLQNPYASLDVTTRFVARVCPKDYDYIRLISPSPHSGLNQLVISVFLKRLVEECKKQNISTYQDYERFTELVNKFNFNVDDRTPSAIRPDVGTPIAITYTTPVVNPKRRGVKRTASTMESNASVVDDVKKRTPKRSGRTRRGNDIHGEGTKAPSVDQ